jgi:hypothetical protein
MPIREMLYYICMSDGFGGDAVNRASRSRVSGSCLRGVSRQFQLAWTGAGANPRTPVVADLA